MTVRDDYARTTQRASTRELPPALRDALVSAARQVQVEDLDARASHLVLTHARRTKAAGFFARVLGGDTDPEHWCALAVTPKAVLVGTHGAHRGTWVRTLPIDTLELESMPALAGELAERTVLLSSPVLGQGSTHPRGSFAVVFASKDDADAARSALEDARAAHWRG